MLVVIVLSVLVLGSSSASLQQPILEKTQNLYSIFQDADATILEFFRQLEAKGETAPQASLYEYKQAIDLVAESKSLLQKGNYSEANEKIVQALQKLKEALRIAIVAIPWRPTEAEISQEMAVQLRSSISRYYEQVQIIENITHFAASVGYNTTILEDRIQTIKHLLEKASNNAEEKLFEAAWENLVQVKTISFQVMSSINNFAADLKIQRIATYINKTQERINVIREIAESLSNEASLAAIDSAETSLDNAKVALEELRIDETLSELANSKVSENEAVENLKLTESSVDSTANKVSEASP